MERLRSPLAAPELMPGLLAVAVFLAWAVSEGAFFATAWYPGGLFLLGLLAATAYGYRGSVPSTPRPLLVAGALLAAFTAWSFLSIAWADTKGDAWDGANRTLLYLIVFALFVIPRWRARSASITLGALSLGLAVLAGVVVLGAAGAEDPALRFIGARLTDPTGYANATAALFAVAFWPALLIASRRETPWPARGVMLAASGVLVQTALLPQSRGALIVFPIALAIYIAIVPNRLRSLIVLLPVGVATLLAAPSLLDVFTAAESDAGLVDALGAAAKAMGISALALLALGAALGLADERVLVAERVTRVARYAVGGLAAIGAVAGLALVLAVIGNPVSWGADRWEDFKGGYDLEGFGASRFSGDLGNNRYDFWQVAISEEFAASPIQGSGADSFRHTYLRERSSNEEPAFPHSIEVRVLAGTGVVGGALFAGFLIAAVVAAARVRRVAEEPLARALAAAALVTAGYWLMHSSADWMWSFPAVTAPVLAALAIAGRLATGEPDAAPPRRRGVSGSVIALVGGAGIAVLAAVSLVLPWGAALDVEAATRARFSDPDGALRRLDRAHDLNPLSSKAGVLAAAIATDLGDLERARVYYEAAIERDPANGSAIFRLGALDALEGRTADAASRLAQATMLNPGDEVIAEARRRALAGDPLSMRAIDRLFAQRVCDRFGRTDASTFCE